MNKGNTPRRKRLTRQKRLNSAQKWIKTYKGKKFVKAYSRWFGVDKLCAIIELRMLGFEISEDYEEQVKRSIEDLAKARKIRKEQKVPENNMGSDPFSDETYAFIAGYTSNGVPFGITHEEMKELNEKS